MSISTTDTTFPAFLDAVKQLVADYEVRQDEPILLAIYYSPASDRINVYLFQVVDQFGYNEVAPGEELFDVEYNYMPDISLPNVHSFHLTTTNPVECASALEQKWPKMMRIVDAVKDGNYRVVRQRGDGERLLEMIKSA